MKPLNAVLAQNQVEILCASLRDHFKSISVAGNWEELRTSVPRSRADVAILDLELVDFHQIEQLRREFPELIIVCTHRLADEDIWTRALSAGAQDCCHPSDVRAIVHAANRTVVMSRTSAA